MASGPLLHRVLGCSVGPGIYVFAPDRILTSGWPPSAPVILCACGQHMCRRKGAAALSAWWVLHRVLHSRPGAFRYGLKRPGMQETFCARRLIATTPYRQNSEVRSRRGDGFSPHKHLHYQPYSTITRLNLLHFLVRTSTKHTSASSNMK